MTLPIGNKKKERHFLFHRNGFTFIEVMVTVAIFSAGIIIIFKAYLASLNQMNHLTNRFYATTIMENRMKEIERVLRVYKSLPLALDPQETVDIGRKKMVYNQEFKISEVDEFVDIFQLDLKMQWKEGQKVIQMDRTAYISDFGMNLPN